MKGLRARLLEQAATNRLKSSDPAVIRNYYQSVVDSVASVICMVDRDLRITEVNRRWDLFAAATYGEHFTSDDVLGTSFLDLFDGRKRATLEGVCAKILNGEMPMYLDEVYREGQRTWRNYTLAASPLVDDQNEVFGITFVVTDITQLKKAEAEMLQRLVEIRGFRQVAQIAGAWFDRRAFHKQVTADIAHLFDAEKCIIFRWGEQSGHLVAQYPAFGLPVRELVDLSLDIGDPNDPGSLWQDLEEQDYILLNEGDPAPDSVAATSARVDKLAAMIAVLRVSGRLHGTLLIAGRDRPFSDKEGQLAAAFAVPIALAIEDAELNQRLLDRVHQLEAVREDLERITRKAEGIRVPLTVIRGYLELLHDGAWGDVSSEQSAAVSTVLTKTREVVGALNQLLPSQLISEATHYGQVDLVDVLEQVYDKWIAQIRLAGTDLLTGFPEDDRARYVLAGDSSELFGVFDTLLSTAIQASPSGGTIALSLHESEDIVYVRIEYPGSASARELVRVWQRLESQEHVDVAELAEVKRVISQYGGHVWAESRSDRRCAVYVVLPKKADWSPVVQAL
jgi:PAS domain S-box-containing protein